MRVGAERSPATVAEAARHVISRRDQTAKSMFSRASLAHAAFVVEMLGGISDCLALRLVANITGSLVHANRVVWHFGPADSRRR